jgi:SAM-dependent methyltransferase
MNGSDYLAADGPRRISAPSPHPPLPHPTFGRADHYALYRPPYPASLFQRLLPGLGPSPLIADLGAGTGQSARPLLTRGARVVAVEPDHARAALLPDHPRLHVVIARVEDAIFAPASLDGAVIGNALHWMDSEAVLERVSRAVRPGGRVLAFSTGPARLTLGPTAEARLARRRKAWRAFEDPRLRQFAGNADALRRSGRFRTVEPFLTCYDATWSVEQATGFLLTISPAAAWLACESDPDEARATLCEELRRGSPGGYLRVRIGIEAALAAL